MCLASIIFVAPTFVIRAMSLFSVLLRDYGHWSLLMPPFSGSGQTLAIGYILPKIPACNAARVALWVLFGHGEAWRVVSVLSVLVSNTDRIINLRNSHIFETASTVFGRDVIS